MNNNFFFSDSWKHILKCAFNTTHLDYQIAGENIVVFKFPLGIFKVSYPNFPIGITNAQLLKNLATNKEMLINAKAHAQRLIISGMNIDYSQLIPSQIIAQPISQICNLKAWNIKNLSSSIKRNIKKSIKNNVRIMAVSKIDEAYDIYDIYLSTVTRHSGKARYNKTYFIELIKSILDNNAIIGCVAYNENNTLIGYMITAFHDNVGYYLHGGINYNFQGLRAMDALFNYSIESAQKHKMHSFNFLTSPADQPNLIRYKEKWGATTTTSYTITFTKSNLIDRFLTLRNKL